MIERYDSNRVLLYKADKNQKLGDKNIKWSLINAKLNYPSELEIDPNFLNFYSDDLMLYLDIDKEANQFVIRSTLDSRYANVI